MTARYGIGTTQNITDAEGKVLIKGGTPTMIDGQPERLIRTDADVGGGNPDDQPTPSVSGSPTADVSAEQGQESVQGAMNMVRAVLFGDAGILSGAIKNEAERGVVADKLNRLDRAIDAVVLEARRDNDRVAIQEHRIKGYQEELERLRRLPSTQEWVALQERIDRAMAANKRLADDHQVQLDRAEKAEAELARLRGFRDEAERQYQARVAELGREVVARLKAEADNRGAFSRGVKSGWDKAMASEEVRALVEALRDLVSVCRDGLVGNNRIPDLATRGRIENAVARAGFALDRVQRKP